MTWRVNLEPVVFLGASRALLMQVAHPLVAAGVDQHSSYLMEPWARLFRTLDVMLKLAFGDAGTSKLQAARLRRIHATVKGVSSEGVGYDARDPALMTWVWATLVDTSLLVYRRAFGPLSPGELDRYVGEQRQLAVACGVPASFLPGSPATFRTYVEGMTARELRVTAEAGAVAKSIFEFSMPPVLGPAMGRLNRLTAAGLLPEPVRRAYGLTWSPRQERWLARSFAAWALGTRLTPHQVRTFPAMYLARRPWRRSSVARRDPTP
jgi:uncharacterized protein (DUF2236 family)